MAAAHAAGRGVSVAAEDRAALDRLVVRQREHLGSAMDELLCYDAKVGHWAWWAFPTPIPGQSEPQPPCYITPAMAPALLDRAPPCWKSLLECLAHLLQRRRLDDVLPARDLARFADFLAFWSEVACPQRIRQVLRSFNSYICGHKACELRRHTELGGGGGGGGDGGGGSPAAAAAGGGAGEPEQPAKSNDVVASPGAAAAAGGAGKHEQLAESGDGVTKPEVAAAAGGTRPEAERPEASGDQSMLSPVPSLSPASAPGAPLKQRPVASSPDETTPSGAQQPPAWTRGDSDGDSSDTEGRPDDLDDDDWDDGDGDDYADDTRGNEYYGMTPGWSFMGGPGQSEMKLLAAQVFPAWTRGDSDGDSRDIEEHPGSLADDDADYNDHYGDESR